MATSSTGVNCGAIKIDPDMSFPADCYPPHPSAFPCEQQQLMQEPADMDLTGFLELNDKMLSGRWLQLTIASPPTS